MPELLEKKDVLLALGHKLPQFPFKVKRCLKRKGRVNRG